MIIVSACLAGERCRMDGGDKLIPEIRRLVEEGRAIPVCPEALGGLPTPREPSELRGGRVCSRTGEDVTGAFVAGAKAALKICRAHNCTGAVLKARSPSCGRGMVHNGRFDGGLVEGNGVFAELLIQAGIPVQTEVEFIEAREKGK